MFDSLLKASAILNIWTWQQATAHQFLQSNFPDDEENNQLRNVVSYIYILRSESHLGYGT